MTVCVQTMSKIRLTEIVNCPDNFSHSYGLILVGAGLVSDKISTKVPVPGHQDSGAPTFFGGVSCYCSAQSYTLSMFCVVHKDRK